MKKKILVFVLLLIPLLYYSNQAIAQDKDKNDEEWIIKKAKEFEKERIKLVQRISPAVVAVFIGRGGGSGVIISETGYALTNFHVTRTRKHVRVGLPEGKVYPADVIGIDPTGDIALIKIKGKKKFPFVKLGDSDKLKLGDWTLAMGNPFLLATDFKPTVTQGVVSGLHRYLSGGRHKLLTYPNCIQVDTSINPGNSGGPLFNMKGELLGINGRISIRRGRINIGVGFAISINQIKNFLSNLRAGKVVYHGTMGATVRDEPSGRTVLDMLEDSSAAFKAGLALGDEIVKFAGIKVKNQNHFANLIWTLPKGRKVEIDYIRLGKAKKATVVLEGVTIPSKIAKWKGPGKEHIKWETKRLLKKYSLAIGNDNNDFKSYIAKGTLVEYGNKIKRSEVIIYQNEDKKFTIFVGKKGKNRKFYSIDGLNGWIKQKGKKKEMSIPLLKDMKGEISALWKIKSVERSNKFKKIIFTGGGIFQGKLIDIIKSEDEDGTKRKWSFQLENHKLLKYKFYSYKDKKNIEVILKNYKKTGKYKMPFVITYSKDGEKTKEIILKKIKVNPTAKEKREFN